MTDWVRLADQDGPPPDRGRRHVTMLPTDDGWLLSGWLDAVSGKAVSAELDRLERQLYRDDVAKAREQLGRDPLDHELSRTAAQRRSDALVEMAERSAAAGVIDKPKPLITIFAGVDAFKRMCQIRGGQPIHPDLAADWLDDAIIESIVFDSHRRDITASKQRTYTGALRRALEGIHRVCFHPYCNLPADRCQLDHVIPWSHGGRTTFANAQLACGHHNRWRTNSHRPPRDGPRRSPP